MSFIVYTGVMGSGKSLEAVKSVVVPGLVAGRRVVTNIDGLNFEKIKAFCKSEFKADIHEDQLCQVQTERVSAPGFFPSEATDTAAVVHSGDLVVLDEAWEFWGAGKGISEEHMRYVRMHRHWLDGQGRSGDVVCMIQDVQGLDNKMKRVVALHIRFVKLTTLGLYSRYRMESYEGYQARKPNLIGTAFGKYDKRYFELYKSHAGGSGREVVVDSRGNLLKSTGFQVIMIGALCLVLAMIGWAYKVRQDVKAKMGGPQVIEGITPAGFGPDEALKGMNPQKDPSCPNRFVGVTTVGRESYAYIWDNGYWRMEKLRGVQDGSRSIHRGCGLAWLDRDGVGQARPTPVVKVTK